LEKGSSNKNTAGFRTMARPKATLWRSPPDNWWGFPIEQMFNAQTTGRLSNLVINPNTLSR